MKQFWSLIHLIEFGLEPRFDTAWVVILISCPFTLFQPFKEQSPDSFMATQVYEFYLYVPLVFYRIVSLSRKNSYPQMIKSCPLILLI